jgi:WD40 repeat protein
MDEFVFNFGFSSSGEYMFYQRSSGWVIFRPSDVNTNLVNKQVVSFVFNKNTNEIGMLYWGDEENVHVWDFDSRQEIRMEKISAGEWELPVMDQPSRTGFDMKGYVNRGTYNTVCAFEGDAFSCYAGPTVCTFDLKGGQDCASVKTQTSIKKTTDGVWEYILYKKDGAYSGLLPPWESEAMILAEDNPPGFHWSMMSLDKKHFMYTKPGPNFFDQDITLHFAVNDSEVGQLKVQFLLNAVISPDSKYMLATVDTIGDQVWLLDLETGEIIKELVKFNDSGRGARGLAFSSDSHLAAYVDVKPEYEDGRPLSMGKLAIYDIIAGKEQTVIDLNLSKGNVNALAFSPDAALIAVGTQDGQALIYNVATGEQVTTWYAHVGVISDLDFSPDGNWLLTVGGMDENIKLWTVAP